LKSTGLGNRIERTSSPLDVEKPTHEILTFDDKNNTHSIQENVSFTDTNNTTQGTANNKVMLRFIDKNNTIQGTQDCNLPLPR